MTIKNILSVDKDLNSAFRHKVILVSQSFDNSNSKQPDFFKSFFENTSAIVALAFLDKLENNIKVIENRMLSFCMNQCAYVVLDCRQPYAILGQSSTYLKSGEKIEITAGVGEFLTGNNATLTVNKREIKVDENGIAIYKFKVRGKAGIHNMPVEISHFLTRMVNMYT